MRNGAPSRTIKKPTNVALAGLSVGGKSATDHGEYDDDEGDGLTPLQQVSERSERALMKTSILAMNARNCCRHNGYIQY